MNLSKHYFFKIKINLAFELYIFNVHDSHCTINGSKHKRIWIGRPHSSSITLQITMCATIRKKMHNSRRDKHLVYISTKSHIKSCGTKPIP
jgi:hypothetical protein